MTTNKTMTQKLKILDKILYSSLKQYDLYTDMLSFPWHMLSKKANENKNTASKLWYNTRKYID